MLVISIAILPLFASGQQKRKLTPKDYELWEKSSKIREGQVSDDGQWIYYSIKTGKCDSVFVRNVKTGFQYNFALDDTQLDEDLVVEKDGAKVLIDPVSLDFLAGAEIDFTDDLIGQHFKVNNPNATSGCGCGTSFSV